MAAKIAELKGMTVEEVLRVTEDNAGRVFKNESGGTKGEP